jgi:hypothetical protein
MIGSPIPAVLGFRRFLLFGLDNVRGEWSLGRRRGGGAAPYAAYYELQLPAARALAQQRPSTASPSACRPAA